MYYFDPSFGYIYISRDAGDVRYGCGAVVPHNPASVTEQRYKRFEGWVPIEPHHVPDEWLLAFKNPSDTEEKIKPVRWGWRDCAIIIPILWIVEFIMYQFLASFYHRH